LSSFNLFKIFDSLIKKSNKLEPVIRAVSED